MIDAEKIWTQVIREHRVSEKDAEIILNALRTHEGTHNLDLKERGTSETSQPTFRDVIGWDG